MGIEPRSDTGPGAQQPRVHNIDVNGPAGISPSPETSGAGESRFTADAVVAEEVNGGESLIVKRKRGRPPKSGARAKAVAPPAAKKIKKEEEDVCFICFDGGKLVLCDRRDCPKAYHPSCVKRDESFFTRRVRWNCGWHLCNSCQRNALFMCYTCPFSLCKTCVKQADISCVRHNKGFCKTCMTTILLIENITQGNNEMGHVDFDDPTSWEYLFKVYWVYLKEKESLTLDELRRATNPWKGLILNHENNSSQEFHMKGLMLDHENSSSQEFHDTCVNRTTEFNSTTGMLGTHNNLVQTNVSKRRKNRKQLPLLNNSTERIVADKLPEGVMDWASPELLEFVAHAKNGDTSKLTQSDVQALLQEYIGKNKLRDPRRKCQIICDRRLENLFGKARVGHFEMLKLLEYHFKDGSCSSGVVHAAAANSCASQMKVEECSEEVHIVTRERKRQARKKVDDRERRINLDSYAAIDIHNMSLIYLRRSLMENLMEDAESFHDKAVGSIVRIRISGNDLKQEMYRLVRVVGTSKAAEPYKIGDKTAHVMLKILNLGKIEDVTIDAISNQDFSEDECRRLRQSMKCGLTERMTVGGVHEKAIALQEVRIKDVLETEILKLNHLRDRASELGHRKELRECVEKLELLKSPEERWRRVREIPEVHADPRMDPIHQSDEDSERSETKQDGNMTPIHSNSNSSNAELIASQRGDMSSSTRAKLPRSSSSNRECERNASAISQPSREDDASRSHESQSSLETDAARILEELRNQVDPCRIISKHEDMTLTNHPRDASVTSSSQLAPSPYNIELEKIWYYEDPSGKVQGPFCMLQLRKWNLAGYFPADLRIWRIDESQDKSVLLTDALSNQWGNGHQIQSDCLESQEARFVSDCRNLEHGRHPDININSAWTDGEHNDSCNSDLKDAAKSNGGQTRGQETDLNTHPQLSPEENQKSSHVASSPSGEASNACAASRDTVFPTSNQNHKPECSDVPSPTPKTDNEHAKSLAVEPGQQFSATKVSSLQSGSSLRRSSGGLEFPDLPSSTNKPVPDHEVIKEQAGQNKVDGVLKDKAGEQSQPVTSVVPEQNMGGDWKSASGQTNFSDLPSQTPELDIEESKSQVTEVKQSASYLPGQDSSTSWHALSSEIAFSVPVSSANQNNEGNKSLPTEHCLTSNTTCQDIGISWSTATSLVGEAVQWVGYSMNSKPCMELDSGMKFSDHPSTTSGTCQFTHSSSAHLDCNTSSWHDGPIIELSTLCDDSVSDLLSEVEALESLHGMTSPNSRIDFGDDSIDSPSNDCFGRFVGLSPPLETGKHDAWSSTCDIQFHSQPTMAEPHPPNLLNLHDCPRNPRSPVGEERAVKPDFTSAPQDFLSLAYTSLLSPVPAVNLVSSGGLGPQDVKPVSIPMPSLGADPKGYPPTSLSLSSMGSCRGPEMESEGKLDNASNFLKDDFVCRDHNPEPRPPPARGSGPEKKVYVNPAYVSANKDKLAHNLPPAPGSTPPSSSVPDTAIYMEVAVIPKLESVSHVGLPPAPATGKLDLSSPKVEGEMKPAYVPPSQDQPVSHVYVPPPPPSSTGDAPSSPVEEGEVEPTGLSLELSVQIPAAHSPKQSFPRSRAGLETSSSGEERGHKTTTYLPIQQQEPTSLPSPNPVSDTSMSTGRGAVAGNTKPSWATSQGTTTSVRGNMHRSSTPSASNQWNRSSQQPRYHGGGGRHSGQKDRSHHNVDPGFAKGARPSWHRQSSFNGSTVVVGGGGGGGTARQPPPSHRGQRVCKFYESGYCKKGASCNYLHP